MSEHRARLVRFFEKYNKEKLATVDKILESYAGKEDQLFQALVTKYGPEPSSESSPPSSPKGAPSAAGGDTRARLVRFFEKYNKEKLATVDTILESYKGKEEQLFEALSKKYGPEPPAASGDSASPPATPSKAPGAAGTDDYKARLVRFFEKYNKEKLATVDKILESYKGKEDQLFQALTTKYGPEPAANGGDASPAASPPASPKAAAPAGDDNRARLVRFFEKYNKEKLPTVDKILESYKGKEDQLFTALVGKYGPEPPAPAASSGTPPAAVGGTDPRSRLVRFFEKYNKEKLPTVDKILESYKGKEDQLFTALVGKYGPEPPAPSAGGAAPAPAADTPRARLVRFFEKYNKEKLPTVDKILESYKGKEDQLFTALVGKYGPEPPAPSGGTSATMPAVDTPRARLVRFFEKYNKEKLPTVDKILESYKGKEDQLFTALVGKYGPEPPAPSAGGTAPAPAADTPRARLVRFFEKYNKEKIPTVDKILESYKGKEDQLFTALVGKYGPEPPAPVAASQPANDAAGNAPKAVTIDSILEEVPAEYVLFQLPDNMFLAKYPKPPKPTKKQLREAAVAAAAAKATPAPVANDPRSRLVRFFEKYNKEKIPTVDKILESYKGKEDQLFTALVGKYGPEPVVSSAVPSAPAADTPRARLVRFFEKYNKEKLPTVDKILESYKGKEDQLFTALVGKYGPEPPAPSAGGAAPAPAADTPRARLVRFFEKYNKEKLPTVDKILESYKGKEDQLFTALVGKYGPEPPVPVATAAPTVAPSAADTPRARLVRFFEKYNREKLPTVDKILESYAGKEDQLFAALVGKYGAEPPAPTASAAPTPAAPVADTPRARLVRFFEKYNKEKLGTVDKILESYAGKEDQLFQALVTKYGAEPPAPSAGGAAPAPAADTPRARLVRFFEKYNKEKLPTVDKILESYKGKEDQLFTALVGKYGPEPPAPAASAGPSPDTPRARLVRFFEKYNKEKIGTVDKILESYAGKEDQLFQALVTKYGPEPEVPPPAPVSVQEPEAAPSASTAEAPAPIAAPQEPEPEQEDDDEEEEDNPTKEELMKRIVEHYKKSPKEILTELLGGDTKTMDFLKRNFVEQDFETRLRRFYTARAPERLALMTSDLSQVSDAAGQRDLFEKLSTELGPEPVAMEAPKQVVLMKKLRGRIEDEELSDEEEEKKQEKEFEVPEELVEAERIIGEAEQAPPGEYSGDEAKCYPAEEEYWVRIQFEQVTAHESELQGANGGRQRTFTEYVSRSSRAGSQGEGTDSAPTSPRSNASPEQSEDDEDDVEMTTSLCRIADRRGIPSGSLCIPCSALVSRAFGALWTPVGPRHRKLMESMQTKDGFLEKLSAGKFGNKWQRRWMKINDFGIHYFETNKPGEKPKGHKNFTKTSRLVEDPSPDQFPKCNDPKFYYFVIFVNNSQEPFALRTTTAQDKAEWIAFLKEGLERLKVTMVGQDPNPARWRARVEGLKDSSSSLVTAEKEDSKLVNTLKERREFLMQQLEEERGEVDYLRRKVDDFTTQNSTLSTQIAELNETISEEEAAVEVRTVKAEEEVQKIEEKKSMLSVELKQAAEHASQLEKEVQELKCKVIDAQVNKGNAEQKCKRLYNKWTNVSEKAEANKAALTGSLSRRKKSASGPGTSMSPAKALSSSPAPTATTA